MNTLESNKATKGTFKIYRNGKLLMINLDQEQVQGFAKLFKNLPESMHTVQEGSKAKQLLKNYL
jgi:hypothetical protein